MRISILDGSRSEDQLGERILKLLKPLLAAHQVRHLVIRDMNIAPCMGDFLCWTRTPGICKNKDDNLLVAEAMIQSDLLVLLTPVTFGGYSSILKKGLDHLIPNISPFFAKVKGETHHKKRYKQYPQLAVIGWEDKADAQAERVFKHLVERNSINLYAEKTYCEIFSGEHEDELITQRIRAILEGSASLLDHQTLPIQETPVGNPLGGRKETQTKIQKALLLVGSPRKEQSSSLCLGSYLCDQLQKHSVKTETLFLYAKGNGSEKVNAKVEDADLVILAFPLYIDSLPSAVIEFLEQLVLYGEREQKDSGRTTQFAVLTNCGFPEAKHNDTAIAIARQFSNRAGFIWKGGIGIGGGNGFGGRSLEEGKQTTLPIRVALEEAAKALVQGEAIAQSSAAKAAEEPYPSSLFRFGAQFFWKAAAAKHGSKRKIQAKPYSTE